MGYGDYLDFGLPAENEEETLARLVNRYAAQDHKIDIFMTDPSIRPVGGGHTVLGQTAEQLLDANPVTDNVPNALFIWEALARCGRGRGKQDCSSPCRQPCSI